MAFDLLNDALIQTDKGWHSLPDLFAAMTRGEVQSFPALRPHQRPAWHMFTVQLAVLALDAAGWRELPDDAADWRNTLRALTADFPDDAPWHLVGDPARPAFLQPPDPGGLKWTEVQTPDALDMLITSRNHDVKREIARQAAPQDWIFALVSLQTMEGFGGAGNYGIARMNGGSSSRVLLGLAPARAGSTEVDPSAWWRRDVALRSTSKAARIAGKEAMGNTGDPWAPIHIAEGKSLTLGDRSFSHEMLVNLMFSAKPEWHLPVLARPTPAESPAPMLIVAEAISRGNSKTDGFKSRVVLVPKAMIESGLLGERPVAVAADLLKDIAAVDLALRNGLALVAAGGNREKVAKPYYTRSLPARDALKHWADTHFFDVLWAMAAAKSDDDLRPPRLAFLEGLAAVARAEFRTALPAIPCASLMRPKAETRGRQRLESGLHHAMKDLKEEAAHVRG